MSQSISLLALTVSAAAALTAHRFVGHDGDLAGAGANALGVTRTDAALDEQVAVDVIGTAQVESGGALAAGALVESDASGRAITKSAGVTVARLAPGASAAGAGELVEVILIAN